MDESEKEKDKIRGDKPMSYVTERVKEISTWSGASLIGLGLVIILGGPFLKLLAWAAIAWGIVSIVKKQG